MGQACGRRAWSSWGGVDVVFKSVSTRQLLLHRSLAHLKHGISEKKCYPHWKPRRGIL